MSTVTIYPRIPNEEWRRHAACSFSADLTLWDAAVEGETPERKAQRHASAKAICRACPVAQKCGESVDFRWDEGIRAGHALPEKKNAARPGAEQQWAS
jgi:hypothetical protein